MFPNMMNPEVRDVINKYKDDTMGWKLSGAGGGGYLVFVSDKPLPNGLQIMIRR